MSLSLKRQFCSVASEACLPCDDFCARILSPGGIRLAYQIQSSYKRRLEIPLYTSLINDLRSSHLHLLTRVYSASTLPTQVYATLGADHITAHNVTPFALHEVAQGVKGTARKCLQI
ncbi:hypothetical protein BTUL_0006g00290 [Botrytis tulipae]|uniref:Uncharacterized protein n=1 Tax=Botrytis tulipae TaxID=87230 RepID=A0A4Z1F3V4_9HELO|nr:hypothetical protein BTUL_0006g00290 [Botrytis tulipae]